MLRWVLVACVAIFAVVFIYVVTRPVKKYMVYYINLDHRQDRDTEILKELDKLPRGAVVERVSGVYDKERGHLGCSKSHVIALEKFIRSGFDTCIIFEDDFEFVPSGPRRLGRFLNDGFPFDVVMVSSNDIDSKPCEHPGFKKVTNAQTTAGYIVSRDFAPVLLQNFKRGAHLLEQDYDHSRYAVDQYWKVLQPSSRWYVFDPPCGRQRKSYSDIQAGVVDYNQ
jgi:hypothetical protein